MRNTLAPAILGDISFNFSPVIFPSHSQIKRIKVTIVRQRMIWIVSAERSSYEKFQYISLRFLAMTFCPEQTQKFLHQVMIIVRKTIEIHNKDHHDHPKSLLSNVVHHRNVPIYSLACRIPSTYCVFCVWLEDRERGLKGNQIQFHFS